MAPAAQLVEEIPNPHGMRQVWGMGDASVWVLPGTSFGAERRQALLNSWRGNRYRERGFTLPPYSYKQKVDDLTDRLMKIDRKLGALMF